MTLTTFPAVRMRRLREHAGIRELVRSTELSMRDVIYPVFVRPGKALRNPIKSMPVFVFIKT